MFVKFSGLYEECPSWYRPYREDYAERGQWCAPIGLHWLLKWGHRAWARSFLYTPAEWERLLWKKATLEEQLATARREYDSLKENYDRLAAKNVAQSQKLRAIESGMELLRSLIE